MWINGWEALDGSQHKNASSITEATKDDVYAVMHTRKGFYVY